MYSQNDEEKIILDYFTQRYPHNRDNGTLEFERRLTVLDVGANDGETLSNSLAVIEAGWYGVLVEASPSTYEKLKQRHFGNDKVICKGVAIGDENGILPFYESDSLLTPNDKSLVSTLDLKETVRWRNNGMHFNKIEVECVTFSNFLMSLEDEYNFDLITIDIEGKDWSVLQQMPLDMLGCEMLIVEHNGNNAQQYIDYANRFGLTLISQNPENFIFAKL